MHCLLGCPMGGPDTNDLLFRHAYTMSSNDATKFADWVAYVVDTTSVRPVFQTGRNWQPDNWLDPEETLEEDDYRGANATLSTDRGHQAPLASFRGTTWWSETNYLSNITPQRSALNQGPWVKLENEERTLAEEGNTVYVLTGPLYERDMPPLPEADEPHRVPSGFWKVITVVSPVGPATLLEHRAYIMDQDAARGSEPESMRVSVEDIERRSGFDLFPGR